MTKFRGLFPPLITTFDENGKYCESRMKDHIDFMIENGSDGVCIGTSTGEFMNLEDDELNSLLEMGVDYVNGRAVTIAGGAELSTADAIRRCKQAESLGYDGVLVISPWYQVHTQREIYAHFAAIREAISIPIIIYNNPPVTGIQLSYELIVKMAEDGIIQYIKDADSDPFMLSRLRCRLGDKLGIFYGHDNNAFGAFVAGADGWISGAANFDPARWSKFVHTCIDDGDFIKARDMWYEMLPYMQLVTVGQNGERPDWIAVIKRGLELRGRKVGTVRAPMLPVTEEVDKKIAVEVKKLFP